MENSLLEIDDLSVGFLVKKKKINIIHKVSFKIAQREILAVIGETGCGKSVTGSAILHLLPDNAVVSGSVKYKGEEILNMPERQFHKLRGTEIACIPQSPATSLNPVMRAETQVTECLIKRKDFQGGKSAVKAKAHGIFERLGIGEREIYRRYPCELSGGMCQRVLISMGAITHPSLLVVDEPTKAIDWMLRREVAQLLRELRDSMDCAMLMITHDIDVARSIADRIAVMYAGEIVEIGSPEEIIENPQHPYTKGLIASLPSKGLNVMEGFMPSFEQLPSGCRFSDRCLYADENCKTESPHTKNCGQGHWVKCCLGRELESNA